MEMATASKKKNNGNVACQLGIVVKYLEHSTRVLEQVLEIEE